MSDLATWFAAETVNLPNLKPDGWAVMGFPLWGEKYFARFEAYCLASLLAPENFAALKGAALVLWTDERERASLVSALAKFDIEVVVRTIPPELLASNKYQILAVVERLLVRTAAKNGRGYTGIFPDFVMSERYLPNLRRLSGQHEAIVHSNLTATAGDGLRLSLKPFRRPDGTLVVPARELGDIGWRHLHAIKGCEVRDEKMLPTCHYLFWRGRDYARIHSPHCNPTWMSPALCRKAPRDDVNALNGWTLDGAIPFFLGPRPYHDTLADEMVVTDIYDQDMDVRPLMPIRKWPQLFRGVTGSNARAYLPYFVGPTFVPLHPREDGLADGEIARQVRAVVQTIETVEASR